MPVTSPEVYLREPVPEDATEFLSLMDGNLDFLYPWVEPLRTTEQFLAYLEKGRSFGTKRFFICLKETGAVVGNITVGDIVRGAFQSAYLGYYLSECHANKGMMTEGLRQAIDHAFDPNGLDLHRLEANIQPGNEPSLGVVRKLGFSKEGFSRQYLRVYGEWKDHERWALIKDDWNGKL